MDKEKYIEKRLNELARVRLFEVTAIGAGLFIFLSIHDLIVLPEHHSTFLCYRLATSGILLFISLSLRHVTGARTIGVLAYCAVVVPAVASELMILRSGGHASLYYAGMILLYIFALSYVSPRFSFYMVSAVLIYSIYVFPIIALDKIIRLRIFFNANFFMVSSFCTMLLLKYLDHKALTGMFGLQYDVAREKQRIEEREERFRAISATVADAVIVMDDAGRVTYWNRAAETIFGYTSDEAVGRDLHMLILPERARKIKFDRWRRTAGHIFECAAVRKDGTEIPTEISIAAFQMDDVWYTVGTAKDITERKRMEEEMRHMAHHDALTGLPNRRLFLDIANIALAEARRNKKKAAVLFLDLDRFKEVNDTLGHEAGDELLKAVTERLKSVVRESDTIARIGGDEFNIILADVASAESAASVAGKIMDSFRRPFLVTGHVLYITASIGISVYPDDSEDIETLFRYADIAMYYAKEHGRNNYQFYNPGINTRSLERMKFESSLRQAIERGELVLYYQPQVDIKTGHMVSAEALVRWYHPEMGLLEPRRFLAAAEEIGLITTIDEWVLRSACSQVKSWMDSGLAPISVTVNLSAREFQNPELENSVSQVLADTGLSPECLHIELTEGVAMSNIEHTAARLRNLTKMGIRVAIDDFGTGCSSLNYLKRLPIQKLKIDRSFVQDIATDPDDRSIISAVTAMAHTMKMKVSAEGVETEDQLSFLNATQCDEAQGYFFSMPLPAEKFGRLMASGK